MNFFPTCDLHYTPRRIPLRCCRMVGGSAVHVGMPNSAPGQMFGLVGIERTVMKSRFHGLFFSVMGVAASGLLAATAAQAGQFKTLNTGDLAAGGSVQAYSSPQNTDSAMEMEVFEWLTPAAGGAYSCNILYNGTGRVLNMSLIGVNGTVVNSCAAAAGGTCSTPIIALAGNTKFQCLTATSFGAPVAAGVYYSMSVQRH